MYAYPDCILMIFCKAPVPGQVKTRLMPDLTAYQAADLHRELSTRTLELATAGQLCPVQLWCAPDTDHPFFTAATADYPVSLKQQQGRDLGERMQNAFSSALADHSGALLVGCDCPSLTETDLEDALTALAVNDVVLSPAEDGGYVLIGLSRLCPELFAGLAWGTSDILMQTRNRIGRSRLRYRELKEQWDLDTPEDLLRYRKLIVRAGAFLNRVKV